MPPKPAPKKPSGVKPKAKSSSSSSGSATKKRKDSKDAAVPPSSQITRWFAPRPGGGGDAPVTPPSSQETSGLAGDGAGGTKGKRVVYELDSESDGETTPPPPRKSARRRSPSPAPKQEPIDQSSGSEDAGMRRSLRNRPRAQYRVADAFKELDEVLREQEDEASEEPASSGFTSPEAEEDDEPLEEERPASRRKRSSSAPILAYATDDEFEFAETKSGPMDRFVKQSARAEASSGESEQDRISVTPEPEVIVPETPREESLEPAPDSPAPPDPAEEQKQEQDPIKLADMADFDDVFYDFDPDSVLSQASPEPASPASPTSDDQPPHANTLVTPPATPRTTTSWTSSVVKKRKKLAPLFGPQFAPKSNRPVFRMLHHRRRDYAATLPPDAPGDDPTVYKIRCYDAAIVALSELDAENIILRDSRHAAELKRKGKLKGWGKSMCGHLDDVRREERDAWERDGRMEEGRAAEEEVDGRAYAADEEREAEAVLASPPGPEEGPPARGDRHAGAAAAELPARLVARIPPLPLGVARELVDLGYRTAELVRTGVMQAPAGPDGSVALKMHPSMPPRRGLSEAVLSREAAAWARHFLELEKARPAEEVVSVAEAVAKEVAGALGKEVVLDLGGSAAADGATDDAIKVAVAAGLRIGEPTVKELVMILSVPEGSGTKDALDSVVERFEERDVALAVLSRSDYSADCIVRVPKEPEIAEPAYAEGERPGDPVMLVKLFAAGSPRAYVHSCFYRSVPAGKTIQLMTKMKLRGSYVWDGAAGLLRQPNGEPMQAETEAEVLKILNLDGEELFRPSSGS